MNSRYEAWLATNPPSRTNSDFIIWLGQRWTEYRKERGIHPDVPADAAMHADFDAWLALYVALVTA